MEKLWSVMHVQSNPLVNPISCKGWKRNINLKITILASDERNHFSQVDYMYLMQMHFGKVPPQSRSGYVRVYVFNFDLVFPAIKKVMIFFLIHCFTFSPFIPCKTSNTVPYPVSLFFLFLFVRMKIVITVLRVWMIYRR